MRCGGDVAPVDLPAGFADDSPRRGKRGKKGDFILKNPSQPPFYKGRRYFAQPINYQQRYTEPSPALPLTLSSVKVSVPHIASRFFCIASGIAFSKKYVAEHLEIEKV